jgi:glucose-6-phosphate isomerase
MQGKEVMAGLTPVAALGTIDQHSQLQLYLEGPNDKVITFLKLKDFGTDIIMPQFYKGKQELEYLTGKSLRKLNEFEEQATELVLKEASRPNASLILPKLDEEAIGELIMFLEMQTAYAGYMYNINPYDQPAVEQGKRFTFGLLERPGYEDYKEKFMKGYVKKDSYIL